MDALDRCGTVGWVQCWLGGGESQRRGRGRKERKTIPARVGPFETALNVRNIRSAHARLVPARAWSVAECGRGREPKCMMRSSRGVHDGPVCLSHTSWIKKFAKLHGVHVDDESGHTKLTSASSRRRADDQAFTSASDRSHSGILTFSSSSFSFFSSSSCSSSECSSDSWSRH